MNRSLVVTFFLFSILAAPACCESPYQIVHGETMGETFEAFMAHRDTKLDSLSLMTILEQRHKCFSDTQCADLDGSRLLYSESATYALAPAKLLAIFTAPPDNPGYWREDSRLRLLNTILVSITYRFNSEDYEKVKSAILAKYGKPKKMNERSLIWADDDFVLSLSDDRSSIFTLNFFDRAWMSKTAKELRQQTEADQ